MSRAPRARVKQGRGERLGGSHCTIGKAEPALNNPGVGDQSASTPVHRRGVPTCLIIDLGKTKAQLQSSQGTSARIRFNLENVGRREPRLRRAKVEGAK